MGKRILNADGTYTVEGKQRPGDGSWRKTAAGMGARPHV